MTESAVKTPVCGKCGVEVRPGTLYCYNCGGYVGPDRGAEGSVTIPVETRVETKRSDKNGSGAAMPKGEPFGGRNLRTAAALRRRAAAAKREPVNVRWEAPDEESSRRMVIVTVGIALFALLAVILALYLK